jgi:hypothetical protein
MSTPRNNGPRPSWRRNIARVGTALGIAALIGSAAALSACSDAPTAAPPSVRPTSAPNADLLGGTLTGITGTLTNTTSTLLNGLLWLAPATQTTATRVIGPAGGTFGIDKGIKITVPKGAVSSNVTFSVTRLPGLIMAYDFQPHGIKFAVPLTIEQPTAGVNLLPLLDPSVKVTGAYYSDASLLNQLLGTVSVSELEPTVVASDKSSVTFTVQHFSGYVVAWGRQ